MKEIFNYWIRIDNKPLDVDNLSIIPGGRIAVDIDGVRIQFASAMNVLPSVVMITLDPYGIFYCRVIGGLLHLINNAGVELKFTPDNG